jgi:predicted CopG family antitoxin
LAIISSFLGENEEAINDVLRTFIKETRENISLLKRAINKSNYKEINGISHKMLPMFRQLNVNTIVPDLEFIETVDPDEIDIKEIQRRFEDIQKNSSHLIQALSSQLAKSPSYID